MKPYYEHGGITIYHGDCREVLPRIAGGSFLFDLALTDPPYGIQSVGKDGKMGGAVAAANRVYAPVHGDDKPIDIEWLHQYAVRLIVWGASYFARGIPPSGRLLVWDKRIWQRSNNHADAELGWDSEPGPVRVFRHLQMGMLHDGYGDIGRIHPNQKPLALIEWCVSLAPKAETIVDPYMGSGTTLRAAKDLGRKATGIEIYQVLISESNTTKGT